MNTKETTRKKNLMKMKLGRLTFMVQLEKEKRPLIPAPSPSNPHGLSFRDSPAKEDGQRVGD